MRTKVARWGAGVSSAILAVIGIAIAPGAAVAADVGSVQGVTVTPQEVYVGEQFSVDVKFSAPATARTGDTFTVNLPTDYVSGRVGTTQVKDASGAVIANCEVKATSMVCTYTDYLSTHADVSGTARLVIIANTTNGSNGLDWSDGAGRGFHTDNVIKPRGGYPQRLAKNGEGLPDGSIRYYSGFPGAVLSPNYSTWTDTYDARLTLKKPSVIVQQCNADGSGCWITLPTSAYTVSFDDANHKFVVEFLNPIRDNSVAYRMVYDMEPQAGLPDLTELKNSVAAGEQTFDCTYIYRDSGGNGGGDQGTLAWSKVDQEGALLKGATFRVTGPNGFDKTITDNDGSDMDKADGRFSLQKLAVGNYTLTEVTAPVGYALAAGAKQATVSSTNLNASFGNVVNTPLAGTLTWRKVDDKGAALGGATFKLVGPNGYTKTITDNGALDSNPAAGEFTVKGLTWGNYTLTEVTAPVGYALAAGAKQATVSSTNLNASFGNVVNTPLAGTLTWRKVDDKGAALGGATFKLVGPNGYTKTITDNGALDSNPAAGEFTVKGLTWGNYTLTEVTAPVGYALAAGAKQATVSSTNLNASFGNVVNTPLAGTLTWRKVDDKGAALGGATFKLVGPNGYTKTITDNGALDSNPAAGEFTVKGLTWGNYTLTETSAPAGYQRSSQSWKAEIMASALDSSFGEIINTKIAPTVDPKKPTKRDESALAITGGDSVLGFATAGVGLVVLGAAALIMRRRAITR